MCRRRALGDGTGPYELQVERPKTPYRPGSGTALAWNSHWFRRASLKWVLTAAQSTSSRLRQVQVSRAFYMGKHQVMQGQWEAVMGSNPSSLFACGWDCPLESVPWEDAQEFVRRLNEAEGTARYRLPTQEEWEYAAREATQERYWS